MAYRLLVWFLRALLAVFFRQIEVVGLEHVPGSGPVIFVGNHPNSLLDPALIVTQQPRRVSFLAKSTLFESRLLRPLLLALGAVPIKRRKDHVDDGSGTIDNTESFGALFELLREGGACGIFPEGISHSGSELAPLRTGAARIALGAAQEQAADGAASSGGTPREAKGPVRIVPCGLNYFRRTRMRSRLLVQFGPPLEVTPRRLEEHARDERAAVRELTDDIDASLRALTLNAPDFETLRTLDTVRRLYTPPLQELTLAQQTELTRRFSNQYEQLLEKPEVQGLYQETARYLAELDALGLQDEQLSRPITAGGWVARLLGHYLLLFVLVPLAVPGLLIHAPALAAAILAGDVLTRRKTVAATTKMLVLGGLVPLAYALVIGGLALGVEPPWNLRLALVAAAVLPLSGWALIRVLERQAGLRRGLWAAFTLFVLRRKVARMRVQRADLARRIQEAVERYVDPSLRRIIPPPERVDEIPPEPPPGSARSPRDDP